MTVRSPTVNSGGSSHERTRRAPESSWGRRAPQRGHPDPSERAARWLGVLFEKRPARGEVVCVEPFREPRVDLAQDGDAFPRTLR